MKICTICKELKEDSLYGYRTNNINNPRRKECRDCVNKRTRKLWKKTREEIFDHYGWVCKCCGENIPEFMTLDHINNDGYKDKNPCGSKKSGKELYLLVKKENFPSRFQTLCHNCNFAKKLKGGCPHKRLT